MFSGKGGVGKTTLSCGLARSWARQFPEQKILLLSTDPAHSLGDVLQQGVTDTASPLADLPNLEVRALDASKLLSAFKQRYGAVLECLVERGSFVQGEDLTQVWDLDWPGLDELMGILEIQRLLLEQMADRIVVDMAPSGHTLNLFGLMDFLEGFLGALDLFQEKHRSLSLTFSGQYNPDAADAFLAQMRSELTMGRQLLQDKAHTACLVVAIAEPMSLLESERFLTALEQLQIPVGGLFINRILQPESLERLSTSDLDRYSEQQDLLEKFLHLTPYPVFVIPQQAQEPVGPVALDETFNEIQRLTEAEAVLSPPVVWPQRVPPGLTDLIEAGRRLVLVGGKGGVGKTTVAAAIAWEMATRHPDRQVRVISIDPAHSLGDAFGHPLGHDPVALTPNLTGQEIDANTVLDQFRQDYLWELADMMSGESSEQTGPIQLAYGPAAWRQIIAQALPGVDEMLSLLTVMDLLDCQDQDLIILDTAPTGHLLRFLEMPTAISDWLAWIFKLWLKYRDVLGNTDLMGRLRTLRQGVLQAQKQLQNPQCTEFILVVQAQSPIIAEGQRLSAALQTMGMAQQVLIHNYFQPDRPIGPDAFPGIVRVHLPPLPRSVAPLARIQGAGPLLFETFHP
ncbi:arsenic transporter [Leptolyngbya sp. 'hensonii']|nr:arsenic transporter [Leptolyngbya sp. 'hensonii']